MLRDEFALLLLRTRNEFCLAHSSGENLLDDERGTRSKKESSFRQKIAFFALVVIVAIVTFFQVLAMEEFSPTKRRPATS